MPDSDPIAPKLTPKKPASSGEWREPFLATLRNTANVRASCHVAGVSREAAYKARAADPEFAEQWRHAMDDALDALEATAFKRASETSDVLLIFLLKSHRRGVYGDKIEVTGRQQLEIVEEIISADPPAGTSAE